MFLTVRETHSGYRTFVISMDFKQIKLLRSFSPADRPVSWRIWSTRWLNIFSIRRTKLSSQHKFDRGCQWFLSTLPALVIILTSIICLLRYLVHIMRSVKRESEHQNRYYSCYPYGKVETHSNVCHFGGFQTNQNPKILLDGAASWCRWSTRELNVIFSIRRTCLSFLQTYIIVAVDGFYRHCCTRHDINIASLPPPVAPGTYQYHGE